VHRPVSYGCGNHSLHNFENLPYLYARLRLYWLFRSHLVPDSTMQDDEHSARAPAQGDTMMLTAWKTDMKIASLPAVLQHSNQRKK